MNAIRSHYLSRRLCLALALMMLSSLMPLGLVSALAQETKTALVFPLQNAAENAPADIAQRATGALTMAVSDTPGFDAIQFSTTSPSVRRAVSEWRVRQVDVEESDRDIATALVVGAALQVDYIIVGSVQSLTRKQAPATGVDIILSGQMYEVAPNINPATGEPIAEPKVFKAFGVSGTSAARARLGGDEGPMISEALRDAASKAAAALSGRTGVVEIAAAHKGKNGNYKWVLFLLLVGVLALGVNNGSGSNTTNPTAQALPPTNVTLEETESGVRVSWAEPTGTTLTVLRYQVERSIDSGPFQRIDPGNLSAGTTSFNDFDVTNGRHVYQYRIRAVYTSGAVSPYALSAALVATF